MSFSHLYNVGVSRKAILNNIQAPDHYAREATIDDVLIVRVRLDVANQPIFWQKKWRIGTTGHWDTQEHHMLPGSRVLTETIGGIRVRAARPFNELPIGANRAVVTIDVVTP